jgi:pimeloyl-ACP methyl ester carboxylesterase
MEKKSDLAPPPKKPTNPAGVLRRVPSFQDVAAPILSRIPRTSTWTTLNEELETKARQRSNSVEKRQAGFDPRLHCAVGEGKIVEVISLLKDKRCDVNQIDYERRTPLHVAASFKNLEMVRLLVMNHADVNATDAHNRTPLFEAGDGQEVVDYLKKHGAVDSLKFFAKKAEKEEQKQGTMESTDVINNNFMRKVVISFMTPLVILLVLNGYWFALKFLCITLVYYFIAVSFFVSEVTIRPPWYRPNASKLTMQALPEYWQGIVNDPKYDLGLDYEDISFTSDDGWRLSGWYVPAPKLSTSKNTGVVLVHGGGRDRRAWLRHVRMLHEEGFEVVLFDFREHGMSEGNGRGFSYGMKERYDVVAAAKYLRSRCSLATCVAMGTSVGGSAAIMGAALAPDIIDIIIAENPITTVGYLQHQHIYNILGGYFKHAAVSNAIFQFFRWCCRKWINVRVGNVPSKHCQASHVIASLSPRPVLLMHGTADEVVPVEHSEILFAKALEPKELWLAPDAFHCGLYDMFPQEFRQRVITFIRAYEKKI